jgi:hypothetical protein
MDQNEEDEITASIARRKENIVFIRYGEQEMKKENFIRYILALRMIRINSDSSIPAFRSHVLLYRIEMYW